MAIAANRMYNDPALGQAFSNLAAAFAPPSGGDLSGYAAAAAKKAEAARLAQLFDYSKSPTFDQTQFDRMGVATGTYAPTQSYYAVDTGAATDRRGQDISAATSRANTTDTVRGSVISNLFSPLSQGQVRPDVPLDIASTVGLPAVGAAQGMPKPLSETEVKGAILQGLPQPDQNALVMSDIPVEQIASEGGGGIYARRSDAVGKPIYEKPTSESVKNYQTTDGRQGTAVMRNGALVDTQTGQPIPANSITFSSSLQGGSTDTGISAPTTANKSLWQKQAAEADYALGRIGTFEQLLQSNPGALGVAGGIQGFIQEAQQGVKEIAAMYGDNDYVKSLEDLAAKAGEAARAGSWDPAIAQARLMALEMAYMEIKSQDPSGEVNVRELERVLPMFNGGFAGNQPVLDALQITKQRWAERKANATSALGGTAAPGAAPAANLTAAPVVEEWVRGPDGKLVRK